MKSAVYQQDANIVNLRISCYNTHMQIIDHITETFQKTFGGAPEHIARAPGRVNLLGEHVDYNEGFVLPAAIDRASYVAFSRTDADQTNLTAVDFDQEASFSPQTLLSKTQADGSLL